MYSDKIQNLINSILSQFRSRTETEGKKCGINYGITLDLQVKDKVLWLSFRKENETLHVTIPLPFEENGVRLIQQNEVVRALCPFWLEEGQSEIDYLSAMYSLILGSAAGFVSPQFSKATPYLQQMIYGFVNGNASIVAYRLQRAINEVVNKMPLHETDMNSFIMNHRLVIIDKVFDEIRSPAERLSYQVEKAKKYFERGWTAIGLSDGTLADKNYILKMDLRKLSPFGIRFHNPQRNLYSTLGMKGDEAPLIRSQSMQELMKRGIKRKGWNLFTAFVDIPDVFEDQIMVDESLKDKFVTYTRRVQLFGVLKIKEGQSIRTGQVLGIAPDGEATIFRTLCDKARVIKISKTTTTVGGTEEVVYNVIIEFCRYFCDAFKVTNLHGNKGVIRMTKLGYAIDPRTGEHRKIEVIVSAKSVKKRKNYGQVLEALMNCILEADKKPSALDFARRAIGKEPNKNVRPVILPDDWNQPIDEIKAGLERRGFLPGGTMKCDTYASKVKAVCGNVFWGVIKTPQDQLWDEHDTVMENGKEVRTAGLKFSHVEIRALETRLGKDNPVVDEIMSYAQGSENLHEMFEILRSKKGETSGGKATRTLLTVRPMDQTNGVIVPIDRIAGTVVDENFSPGGFLFQLPFPFMTILDRDGEVLHEGAALARNQLTPESVEKAAETYTTNFLYFPSSTLRRCWRHATGKYGLSEIGVLVNNVVVMSHRLMANLNDPTNYRLYYGSISAFFHRISQMMGTKRGDIATYAMSVRYPFSAKATATLSTTLPRNTIEIHRDMADIMKAKNGDIVVVERFPCLGFMSTRLQQIRVTDDPMCKYSIRASGNSLVSENLDFDGDTLFLATFHTPAAKVALRKEWMNPNKTCYDEIMKLNVRKGAPHIKEFSLDDFEIKPFPDLVNEVHAELVERATGIKAQTGPVIALTYNIMRLIEDSDFEKDHKMRVAAEMFLEKGAQSVFAQKHGTNSLYEIVMDGVCTADVEWLVSVGFKRSTTEKLCGLVVERAREIGVFDLKAFHEKIKERGGSNILSRIVRKRNRIYFASRSTLEGINLLKAIESPAVDVPSRMFKWAMAGKAKRIKTTLDELWLKKEMKIINNDRLKAAGSTLCDVIDGLTTQVNFKEALGKKLRNSMTEARNNAH